MAGRNYAVAVALLAALVMGVVAGTAAASFPGRNGMLVVSSGGSEQDGTGGIGWQSLIAVNGSTWLASCSESWGDWPAQEPCTVEHFDAPTFSPDGRRIAFDAGEALAIVSLDGTVQVLPRHSQNDGNPAFSPDGRQLAFDGIGADGIRDVYVTDDYLRSPTRLTQGANPTWSSRGQIAFFRAGGIHVTDENGRDPRRVARGSEPDWSPHGSKLAVVRDGDVHVVDPRHLGRVTRITRSRSASAPAWSPDGRLIAFDRAWLGVSAIGAKGRNSRILDRNQQGDSGSNWSSSPTWRPLR